MPTMRRGERAVSASRGLKEQAHDEAQERALQAETGEQRGPAVGLPASSASQSSNITGSLASPCPAMPSSIGFASHINFSI